MQNWNLELAAWEQATSRSVLFELGNSLISHVHSTGVVPDLVPKLMRSNSDDVREVTSWVITELGSYQVEVFGCIQAGLEDSNPAVRHLCCMTLLDNDVTMSQHCVDHLLVLLADEDAGVLHAVSSLLMCPALVLPSGIDEVSTALSIGLDERVILAINSCRTGEAACRECLASSELQTKLAALVSAYRFGAVAIVEDAFHSRDPLVRSIAASNSYRFGNGMIPAVVNVVNTDQEGSVRASGWSALKNIAKRQDALSSALKETILFRLQPSHGENRERTVALSLLEHFIPLSLEEFTMVCNLLKDEEESVRFWASSIAEATAKSDPKFLGKERLADPVIAIALDATLDIRARDAALRVLWYVPPASIGRIALMYPHAMTRLLADEIEGIVMHALDLIRRCEKPPKLLVLAVEGLAHTSLSEGVQKACARLISKWTKTVTSQ